MGFHGFVGRPISPSLYLGVLGVKWLWPWREMTGGGLSPGIPFPKAMAAFKKRVEE
jgi:hypothetical protein